MTRLPALFIIAFVLVSASLSATELSKAVALMKEKSFRPLATGGNLIIRTGAQGEGIYGFGHEAVWEPKSQQILYVGAGHHDPMTFNLYKAETNEWRTEGMDRLRAAGEELQDHSYDRLTADDKGNFYFCKVRMNIFNTDSNAWVVTKALDADMVGIIAAEFFPELKSIFYLINGKVSLYKSDTGVWEKNVTSRAMGGMHQIAEYNPVHHVMVFGGGVGSRQFYVMDSSRNIRSLKPTPFEVEVAGCLMAPDPVSGKMIVFKDGEDSIFAWDIVTDTWEKVCKNPITDFKAHDAAVATITDFGVIALLGYQYPVLLFKYRNMNSISIETRNAVEPPVLSCFPNPFVASTRIQLPENLEPYSGFEIFNTNGQRIQCLSSSGLIKNQIQWNRKDWSGRTVSAGVYYGRVLTGRRNHPTLTLFIAD